MLPFKEQGWHVPGLRKEKRRNELSPDETAMLIRQRQLDMMNYGVLGSDIEIPNRDNSKAITLPHLLGYSHRLNHHFDVMRGVLHAPNQFQITPYNGLHSDETIEGDVLYHQEGKNHIYSISNNVISPFTNPFIAAGDNPMLYIYIIQDNNRKHGTWGASYHYLARNRLSEDNIGSSFLFPEKHMTLNFWYSPKQLTGKDIYDYTKGDFETSRKNTKYIGEEKREGFRKFNFHFDAAATAETLESEPMPHSSDIEKAEFLRQKGDVEFSVVEVGTVMLGGKKHWVYTGSEHAQVAKKQPRTALSGAHQLNLASS